MPYFGIAGQTSKYTDHTMFNAESVN